MPDSSPEPLYTFKGDMKSINCLLPIVNESDELLYVGTMSGQVHIWDLKSKREMKTHAVGKEACLCIVLHNDLFLTQLKGDSIKFWTENSCYEWKLQKILKHDYYGFCRMGLLKNFVYLPNSGSDITIYDTKNNNEKNIVGEKNLGEIMCLKVVVYIESILVCYESGNMIVWDMDLSVLSKLKITEDCPMTLDFCEQTREGILGTNSHTLLKFALNYENKNISVIREAHVTNPGIASVAINDEGKLCIVGCWDQRIRYYSMKKLSLLAVLVHHNDTIDSIVFINKKLSFCNKGLVVAGGKDSRVSLWNLFTKPLKI